MLAAYLPRRVQTKLLHRPMPFNSHHHVHDEHHSKNRILDAMIHERLDPFRYRMIEKKKMKGKPLPSSMEIPWHIRRTANLPTMQETTFCVEKPCRYRCLNHLSMSNAHVYATTLPTPIACSLSRHQFHILPCGCLLHLCNTLLLSLFLETFTV